MHVRQREKKGLSNILVKPLIETGARKRAELTMSEKNVPVKAKTGYMKDNKKGRQRLHNSFTSPSVLFAACTASLWSHQRTAAPLVAVSIQTGPVLMQASRQMAKALPFELLRNYVHIKDKCCYKNNNVPTTF